MKKTLKKLIAAACAVAMLGCATGSLAACGGGGGYVPSWKEGNKPLVVDPGYAAGETPEEDAVDKWDDPSSYDEITVDIPTTTGTAVTDYNTSVNKTASAKQGSVRTYTAVVPSMWNALDSMDNNNNQIMDYLSSAFFEADYKFDADKGGKFNADGTVNYDAIIDGQYEIKFSAVTKLDDVTSEVTGNLAYTQAEKDAGGYAWKLTFRDDLKWDNGDAIKAQDFAYSMEKQLSPTYNFKRADSFFSAVTIKGAREYAYQGRTVWSASSALFPTFEGADDSKLVFSLGNAEENKNDRGGAVCNMRSKLGAPAGWTAANVAAYMVSQNAETTTEALAAIEGKTYAEIKADADMKATFDACIEWWKTDPNEELDFFVTKKVYEDIDYDGNVGVYAVSDTELIVCYTTSRSFIKPDGSLSYLAAYELSDLPLVHKATFEANHKAPSAGQTLATNTYQSSLASSRSWGPYKLTAYQAGKQYKLEKNPYWYGYNLKDNTNQYNVTSIVCEQIADEQTAWMKFLNGEIDGIGIDVAHADDYRNSKYAVYTPGTYTFSWHLFSGLDTLKQSGRNNGILAIDDFRKALSLAIDRDAYAAAVTTAYQGAYGYLNEMYYYDVENGGVYRLTDEAKSGLLRAYGYTEGTDGKWSLSTNQLIQNKTLDEAYETLTGYNLDLAKEYVEKAYDRLTTYDVYYEYDNKQKIQIKFGASVDDDSSRREFNYIRDKVLTPLFKGTSLEGKVELVFDASFGEEWDSKFMAGEYELCTGAWGSAAFNPQYFIGAYLMPGTAYTETYWDTESETLTFTVPGEAQEFPGSGKVRTMTIMNWYRCLNGQATDSDKYKYDWGEGKIAAQYRNAILAKLEEVVLTKYYSLPTITQNSASLLGAKFSYGVDKYNTFMGYGGMRYRIVNYTDSEWTAYVSSQGGNLETEYKKTAE